MWGIDHDLYPLAAGRHRVRAVRRADARPELLLRRPHALGPGLFRRRRVDSLVRQRRGLRRRLSLGRVVPRHLRHDRLLRLRRLLVFDRLSGRLDRGAVRHRRAAQAAGPVHVCRRARQPLPIARHQALRRHQHAGRQHLLPDSADGRRRRAGQAAVGPAALGGREHGRRRGDADRRHGRHGLDDLRAVSSKVRCWCCSAPC